MTGAAAYKVWARALMSTEDFRVQSRSGLPQGYERLSGAIEVLIALKLVLVESVTSREDGALGVISRELHLLQQDLNRDVEALKEELCAPPAAGSTASPDVASIEELKKKHGWKAKEGQG